MTTATSEQVQDAFTAQDVEEAKVAAFAEHGYTTTAEDETVRLDLNAVVTALMVPISQAVAEKPEDRAKVMVTRGTLMATAFPGTPGPNEWGQQDNPALAQAVYKKLDELVWGLCVTTASGKVQQRVGSSGRVLCRCKLAPTGHNDAVEAVYLTRNKELWMQDTYTRVAQSLSRKVAGAAREMSLFMARVPEAAKDVDAAFKKDSRLALNEGKRIMLPALEAAGQSDSSDDEGTS